jgi:hypothetical protein
VCPLSRRTPLTGNGRRAQIERHASEIEELDVEGILAFAERVLPNAADLWVQASLDQKQRLQQLFFPEGLRFDGKRLVRTRCFQRLRPESYKAGEFGGPDFHQLEPTDQLAAWSGWSEARRIALKGAA